MPTPTPTTPAALVLLPMLAAPLAAAERAMAAERAIVERALASGASLESREIAAAGAAVGVALGRLHEVMTNYATLAGGE